MPNDHAITHTIGILDDMKCREGEVEQGERQQTCELDDIVSLRFDIFEEGLPYPTVKDTVSIGTVIDGNFFTVDLKKYDDGEEGD